MGNSMKIELGKKPSVDDSFLRMFGVNNGDIQYIELARLTAYKEQPFKPYANDKLMEMAEDIAERGILSPLLVRPRDNTYQILAGHNRAAAAKLAGLDAVPCIVKNVDDEEAQVIMLNTNLNQREKLYPSEKAFAYKMRMESMKRQAGRPLNDNVSQLGTQKRSDQIVAEEMGESRNQIQRYVRLTELIPALLNMVDNETLSFGAGVSLSYCNNTDQQTLLSFMDEHKILTVSIDQADRIKNLSPFSEDALPPIFGIKEKKAAGSVGIKMLTLKIPTALLAPELENFKPDDEFLIWLSGEINNHMRKTSEGA